MIHQDALFWRSIRWSQFKRIIPYAPWWLHIELLDQNTLDGHDIWIMQLHYPATTSAAGISNKIDRTAKKICPWSMWHPNSGQGFFFFFFLKREMMMQINPHEEILIKKLKPWIEYSSIWMLKIGPTEPGHPSKQTKDQLGPKQFPNIQEISLSGIVLIRQLTTRGSANCRNRQQANQFLGLI